MGVTMSDQRAQAAGLFVTKDLQECAAHLATNTERIDDFIQFVKDGSWIDLLADPNYFQMQTRGGKLRLVPATFYSGNAIPVSPLRAKVLMQGTQSVRTSSASTRESCQTMENFKEFYADLQERTCFQPEQLAAFLISIVHTLYAQTGERKAITESDFFDMSAMDSYSYDAAENAEANPDIALLQEMLLSVAAYFDGRDLFDKLISQDWLQTLDHAVNECSLDVCICEVQDDGKLQPVLINNVARKRIQALHRGSCKNSNTPDFLHLWSIEHEDILQDELQRCITNAIPVQLYAVHALNHRRTTLNLTHVFDSAGRHRYVLGVQMDVADDGRNAKQLQYLRDTSLLIAHVIRFRPPSEAAVGLVQETSPATVVRKFSA